MEKLDPPIQARMSLSIYALLFIPTYTNASLTENENAEVKGTKDYTSVFQEVMGVGLHVCMEILCALPISKPGVFVADTLHGSS